MKLYITKWQNSLNKKPLISVGQNFRYSGSQAWLIMMGPPTLAELRYPEFATTTFII